MNSIVLKSGRKIGPGNPTFIIAEAGVNHNGSTDLAYKLIDEAVNAGADAVKFQSFLADEIILKKAPKAQYHLETTGSDEDQSWYELLKSQEISNDMHDEIVAYCKKKNILFLSTPYDIKSLNKLLEYDIELIKVASTDNNNIPFLRYMAKQKVPIILSTAMINIDDIELSIKTIKEQGLDDIIIMQCTGSYPAPIEDTNLNVINTFKKKFNLVSGYSDHVNSTVPAIVSIGLGSSIYETHFTIDKSLPGPDHRASLEPSELKNLIKMIRDGEKSLGLFEKTISKSEEANYSKLKKFLVSTSNIKKDDIFSYKNIFTKRTGGIGLEPKYFDDLIGKKSPIDIEINTPITLEVLNKLNEKS
tara:strand:+ start:8590 stop:9669 length:1080 start_codon:yes stop_codon:yes gene_type:complete